MERIAGDFVAAKHLLDDLESIRKDFAPKADSDSVLDAAPSSVDWQSALERLQQGNKRYRDNATSQRDFSAGRAARAAGQAPFAAIVACADSRVAPEFMFDQNPGDLFVCRLAGNVVTTDVLASLEYAVGFLGTKLIFVLGHSNCGAVDAAIKVLSQGAELPGHIQDLAISIAPSVARARMVCEAHDMLAGSVKENVRLQMERLLSRSAVLAEAKSEGKIGVAGGVYHLHAGAVEFQDAI